MSLEYQLAHSNKILVACSGKIGSGKDTFADYAVSNYGFVKIPFAKALKDEVRNFLIQENIQFEERNLSGTQSDKECIIPFSKDHDLSHLVERYDFLAGKCRDLTYRYLMQLWGTEYRRNQDDNYWVNKMFEEACNYDRVIVSDVRFLNEFNAISSVGGITVRINRSDLFNTATSNHPSEISLDHIRRWTYIIKNNSTLDSYLESSKYILDEITGDNK